MDLNKESSLKNWIPLRLILDQQEPLVEWFFVGKKPFTEPFFEDTVSAIKRESGKKKSFRSVSSIDMMLEWSFQMKTASPAALIFHVSRCGSTLLSQMLSLDPANIVLSETPFFDDLLRMSLKNSRRKAGDCTKYLLAAMRFYGQKRTPHQQYLFVKTDSWHLHFYESLRETFPGIPFILLYREPGAVLRSQQQSRGMHAVPGMIEPELFQFSAIEYNLDQHLANVLYSYYAKMIDIVSQDPHSFLFNYRDGIPNLVNKLYNSTDRQINTQLQEQHKLRSQYNAKVPAKPFLQEGNDKIATILLPAFELYQQLYEIGKERGYK
ncbi:MAG: sulfotransferase [Bacteroidota bacterium]